jgi:hypothetical protein
MLNLSFQLFLNDRCLHYLMPCYNARAAAQSIQHIWITDDVLAQAFHRFARVSQTHRRHGSTVPGPLEARRRLAKRSMGMGAITSSSVPPASFDIGALFGLRSAKPPPDFEKEWKWQPPSSFSTHDAQREEISFYSSLDTTRPFGDFAGRIEDVKITDMSSSTPNALSNSSQPTHTHMAAGPATHELGNALGDPLPVALDPETQSAEPSSYTPFGQPVIDRTKDPSVSLDHETQLAYLPSYTPFGQPVINRGKDPSVYAPFRQWFSDPTIVDSQAPVKARLAAFEELLEPLTKAETLDEKDVGPLLDFLGSSANVRDANLTLRLVQALDKWSFVEEGVWQSIALNIEAQGATFQTSPAEVAAILHHLLYHREDWKDVIPMFAQLPRILHSAYPRLIKQIFKSSTDRAEQIEKINVWLSMVRPFGPSPTMISPSDKHWRHVYALLAPRFDLTDFPEHFARIIRHRFAQVLMQAWVPAYAKEAFYTARRIRPEFALTGAFPLSVVDRKDVKHYRNTLAMPAPDWRKLRGALRLAIDIKFHSGAIWYILNALVRVLDHAGVPFERLLTQIYEIYMATQPASKIRNLFNDLREADEQWNGFPVKLATRLVGHFLKQQRPTYALAVFTAVPSIPLKDCYSLPIKLIQHGRVSGMTIMNVLHRATPYDTVPSEFRAHKFNRLHPNHVKAIHAAAYAWACSPHINARMAFRRVWELYRLLLDRNAPLSSQMSRAMVRAGISRAVKETGRLSKTQVAYIVGVVEKIEGSETAIEVDKLTYDHWQKVFSLNGYKRGTQQDQEGKYWYVNRRIWSRRRPLPPPPPRKKKNATKQLDDSDNTTDAVKRRSSNPVVHQSQPVMKDDLEGTPDTNTQVSLEDDTSVSGSAVASASFQPFPTTHQANDDARSQQVPEKAQIHPVASPRRVPHPTHHYPIALGDLKRTCISTSFDTEPTPYQSNDAAESVLQPLHGLSSPHSGFHGRDQATLPSPTSRATLKQSLPPSEAFDLVFAAPDTEVGSVNTTESQAISSSDSNMTSDVFDLVFAAPETEVNSATSVERHAISDSDTHHVGSTGAVPLRYFDPFPNTQHVESTGPVPLRYFDPFPPPVASRQFWRSDSQPEASVDPLHWETYIRHLNFRQRHEGGSDASNATDSTAMPGPISPAPSKRKVGRGNSHYLIRGRGDRFLETRHIKTVNVEGS